MNETNFSLFNEIEKKLQEQKSKNTESIIEAKMTERNQKFSKRSTIEDFREDKQEVEINLRRVNREDKFDQFRRQQQLIIDNSLALKNIIKLPMNIFEEANKLEEKQLGEILLKFRSSSVEDQYFGIVCLRKLIALRNFMIYLAEDPVTQEIIDNGLVYDFIKYLNHDFPEFQYEALWCLTNIASSPNHDYSYSIINKDGIPKIIAKMDSNIREIQEQAIWALGNIAGESVKVRDKVIANGGLEKVMNIFKTADRPNLIKNCVWALSNICRKRPPPEWKMIKPAMDLILRAISKLENDNDFLNDSCWVLSYLSENYKTAIPLLLSAKGLEKILRFLENSSLHVQLPCLRILGNIVAGNAKQTQTVIEAGALPYLKTTLKSDKKSVRKETCWILSNMAAGTQLQIESLINNDFLPCLTEIIRNDEIEIKKEAIWAVCNFTSTENKSLAEKIIKQNIVDTVCFCLFSNDPKIIAVSLEALHNLLMFGKTFFAVENVGNPIVKKIEQLGMCDRLEQLQYSPIEIIYEKVEIC